MRNRLILDLCGGTGAWSSPYRDAGYRVIVATLPVLDVRGFGYALDEAHGILMAPPCTMFANSGSRWKRTEKQMEEALSVVFACLRIAASARPKWWVLENPVGKLRRYLGDPVMTFNPCDYGDPWTKKTLLWGKFNIPIKHTVEPIEGSKMHRLGPSEKRQELRSVTPPGFARAFFEANP